MSQLHPLKPALWALLIPLAACSGSVEPSPFRDNDDEVVDPPSENSLVRNPEQPLLCSDPKGLNVKLSAFSRLTNMQYLRTLRDLAAPVVLDESLGANLPTEVSDKYGFLNNYDRQAVEAKSIEQYEATAWVVAKKLVAELPSLDIDACGADPAAACARSFIENFGRRAFRRPLLHEEKQRFEQLYEESEKSWGFTDALTVVASTILSAPQVIYRIENGVDDGRGLKLSGYEMASRLSYLLWGTTPDAQTLSAAESGDLETGAGLRKEVTRLLEDPRATQGLMEFAAQWLRFGKLGSTGATKNRERFPEYTEAVSRASFEGLQLFVQDALLGDQGGVQKLLSSDKAWVNAASAPLYGVSAQGSELTSVELDRGQRRGLLTQAALLAGFSHPEVQSAVQRGVFVLEHFLCSTPPPPPPNVPSAPPPEANDEETTRQKFVRAHEGQAGCKACHERLDAVGFTFENYDATGRWQTVEIVGAAKKELPVDASGAITETFDADGTFSNAVEMIERLTPSEQVAQCFVQNFYRYALARDLVDEDGCAVAATTDSVVAAGGSFKELLLAAVGSNQFRYRAPALP